MIKERHRTGPCLDCKEKAWLRDGLCALCRTPGDRREIRRHGVPWGSANALAIVRDRARRQGMQLRVIRDIVAFVHPRLMENIRILRDGTFRIVDKRYVWLRRSGWMRDRDEKRDSG